MNGDNILAGVADIRENLEEELYETDGRGEQLSQSHFLSVKTFFFSIQKLDFAR